MKKLLFSIATASMMFTGCVQDDPYVPPTPEASDVVLNEIMSKDLPETDQDFVELYNKGEEEVDISGYLINDAADPKGGFVIPAGTKIAAKGYYVVHQPELTVSISSGGEDVSLGQPDGTLMDLIYCEASVADGSSFSRIPDGGDTWLNGTEATPGTANVGEVGAVTIAVDYLEGPAPGSAVDVVVEFTTDETVTEVAAFFAIGDSPAYDENNKTVGTIDGTTATISMTASAVADELVSFFIAVTLDDGTVLYFDKSNAEVELSELTADTSIWNKYMATNAPTLAVEFSATPTLGYASVALTYAANIEIEDARIYFAYGDSPAYIKGNKVKGEDILNDPAEEGDFTQEGVTIPMADRDVEDADGVVIANTSDGGKVSFYVRLALANGNEYYFGADGVAILDDAEGLAGDAFKADPTLWNNYTPKAAADVSSITFPETPAATDDINVVVAYSSVEDIIEARIYYTGSENTYVKGNKIKGEDEASFTQTGVTIPMAGEDIEKTDGSVVETTSTSGVEVKFYLRIAVGTAETSAGAGDEIVTSEYYYGADGVLLAVDDSPSDGAVDTSDAFKENPGQWMSYTVQ